MRLKERFDAWVQGMVQDAVKKYLPSNSDLMYDFIQRMDMQPLACLVAANDDLTSRLVSEVREQLEEDIDTDEIARKVAETISAADVADHMDAEDVAGHVEVDADEIAEKVAEDIDVSSCIDYDKLAEALVTKLKEALV
jgi:hypothetical protein